MKRQFLHLVTTLLAGACLVMTSCSDSDTDDGKKIPEPNFPATVTPTVAAGGSYTFKLDPNQKWEISIPTTAEVAKWFWIQDGSQKVYRVQGEAGSAEVTVCVSDLAEFDQNRSCEVTMTMGGETKVIGTITRGTVERTLSLYTSKLEDGDFAYNPNTDSDLSYDYPEQPTQQIDLLWPEGRNGYMYPVMIEANFDWRLKEKSDWITDLTVSSGGAGTQTEIRLTGDVTKYPLDGDDNGTIVFCDKDNDNATYTFKVTIPACRDILRIGRIVKDTPLEFNAKGQYYTNTDWVDGGALGDIVSIEGSKFFVVVKDDNGYYASPEKTDWVIIEEKAWDNESGAVVQTRNFTVKTAPNTGDERKAELIALPASLAAGITDPDNQLFTADYMSLKTEYQPYVFGTVKQAMASGVISASNAIKMAEVGAELTKLSKNEWPWMDKWSSIPAAYKLTYTKDYSWEESLLLFETEFSDYEIYGFDGAYDDPYDKNNCWIKVEKSAQGVTIKMDPKKNTKPGLDGENEATILFKNADGTFALLYCVFDPNAQIGGGGEGFTVSFAYPDMVQGATLEAVTEENIDAMAAAYPALEGDFRENLGMGIAMYVLTYNSASPSNAVLDTPGYQQLMIMPMSGAEWLDYEPLSETQVLISMEKPAADQAQTAMAQFLDSSWNIKCIVYCIPAF